MNKIINIFFIIALLIILVSAQSNSFNPISQEDFNKHLEELKEKGTLNKEVIENIEKLHYSQKNQIISTIDSNSEKFWTQWKEEFSIEQKRALLKEVSLEKRNEFMKKYGEHYGVNFINLGDESIIFGKENTIGNKGAYFQIDMIEDYNKKNPGNKIASIEYKINSMIFKYEKGNYLEISTEEANGFYFNPDSNYLGKVREDGTIDRNSPLTGHWNGKGNLKLSTNNKGTNINFDFGKDAKDPVDYSKFTNLKGESYSVFQDPTGKDDKGNTIYELKSGELNFDTEGKLTKISNMYKNPEINKDTKSWGGFFGKDTSVVYSEGEFESTKGSKILVDIEKGQIKAESARMEEGFAVSAKNVISKLQEGIEKIREKIENKLSKISNAHDILKKAQEDYIKADSEYKTSLEKDGIFSIETTKKDAKRLLASIEFIKTKKEIQKRIAKDIGLTPENSLVKTISSAGGLAVTKNVLKYASEGLGAVGDVSNGLIKMGSSIDYLPIFKSLNPVPESRIDVQLNNPAATQLKNIEMYDGSLKIADSYGNLVPVVKRATSYGYVLPSTLNKQTNYFDGINFDLYNKNYENGQEIKIFSSNGKLNAIGVGLQDLKTVYGKNVIDAGGGVIYSHIFSGGERYKGKYANVLTADYKTSQDARERAIAFQREANNQYKLLYDKYKTGGWTKEEITELTKKYESNFVEYNKILNSQDVELSISSNKLNRILGSFSGTGNSENNPIIKKIEFDTFNNDRILQKQLAERGINPFDTESFVNKEIANIDNFIRSNSGTYLQFVKDSKSGIYQVKTAGNTYNVDPVAGPFISNILPVIAGHGGIDKNGNFYIDTTNSRFGKSIGINVYGGHYKGVRESLYARENADAIERGIQNTVKKLLIEKLADPASQGYKIYYPRY